MTTGRTDEKSAMRRVTLVICAVLALQFGAVIGRMDAPGFPFVDYPMYSSARFAGNRVDDRSVVAILADGRRDRIEFSDVDLDDFQYAKWVSAILRYRGPQNATTPDLMRRIAEATGFRRPGVDLVRLFVERYERRQGVSVVRLQVEDGMAIVTRQGMVMADEPLVMRDLELAADDGVRR